MSPRSHAKIILHNTWRTFMIVHRLCVDGMKSLSVNLSVFVLWWCFNFDVRPVHAANNARETWSCGCNAWFRRVSRRRSSARRLVRCRICTEHVVHHLWSRRDCQTVETFVLVSDRGHYIKQEVRHVWRLLFFEPEVKHLIHLARWVSFNPAFNPRFALTVLWATELTGS